MTGSKNLYPNAIPSGEIIEFIGTLKQSGVKLNYGYECIYISPRTTRPSLKNSLYISSINSPSWKDELNSIVNKAVEESENEEEVYFVPM